MAARSSQAHAAALPAPAAKPLTRAPARGAAAPRARGAAAPRARLQAMPVPIVRILAFVICLALLAVGRVTLSFAVVQKSLQTDAVVREYRALDAKNAQLEEQAAGLSSSLAVRNIAVNRYHLVVPGSVEYLDLPPLKGDATRAGAGQAH